LYSAEDVPSLYPLYFSIKYIVTKDPVLAFLVCCHIMHCVWEFLVWYGQAALIVKAITTNEQINWHHYKYLQDGEGGFRNPYDKGMVNNTIAFVMNKM